MMTREEALDLFQQRRPDRHRHGGRRRPPQAASGRRRQLHHRPQHQLHQFLHRVLQLLRVLPAAWATRKATSSRRKTIFEKIQETLDLGGTGVLMQGGLHPDLKIEWYEDLFRSIKQRFPIHLHCLSAPEVTNIAEVSGLSLRDTIARLRDAGLDSIPGGGAEILDDAVRHRISRLKCSHAGVDRRASHRALSSACGPPRP